MISRLSDSTVSVDDRERLTAALAIALRVAPKARSVERALFFQLATLRVDPNSAPQELHALWKVIRSIKPLDCFEHSTQITFGYPETVNAIFLAGWLISRSQQSDVETAISGLERYLLSDSLVVTEILAVRGVRFEQEITAGGYRLVPWAQLPVSDRTWRIAERSVYGARMPDVAILRDHTISSEHQRPWNLTNTRPVPSVEPIRDVLRCISAASSAGIQMLHYWFEPPEWAPWAANFTSFGTDASRLAMPVTLDEAMIGLIGKCVDRFSDSEESCRTRLRIPLDRLNQASLAGMDFVTAAIEIGIALESLYVPSKLSEGIGYALRIRAARHTAGNSVARRATAKLVKDLYDLRSRAIHAGRFDADGKRKWLDSGVLQQVMEQGRRLVGQSLMKVILEGEPAWDEFDLGVDD